MAQPAILDLLNGSPLSAEETRYWIDDEKRGDTLYAYNVEVTPVGCATETIPVLASNSIDAMTRAVDILYPNWDQEKPKSGMKIKVVSFDWRK